MGDPPGRDDAGEDAQRQRHGDADDHRPGIGGKDHAEGIVAERELAQVHHQRGQADAGQAAGEPEDHPLEHDHPAQMQPGVAQRLHHRIFLDLSADREQDGVGDQSEDGDHGGPADIAAEADQGDDFRDGLGDERLFRPGIGRRLVGMEHRIDRLRDLLAPGRLAKEDIELGDGAQAPPRCLLEIIQMQVADIHVLRIVRGDDAGHRDRDAGSLELVADLEAAAVGHHLAHQRGIAALLPGLDTAVEDLEGFAEFDDLGGRDAAEGDDIQAGAAIVDDDLDRVDRRHTGDLGDL